MVTRPAPTETQRQEERKPLNSGTPPAGKLRWKTSTFSQLAVCASTLLHAPHSSTRPRLHNVILGEVLLEVIIGLNTFTSSDAHVSYLIKFLCSREPLSGVRANQSPEGKPERTGMLSSRVSSYHSLTSTPAATTAERPGPQTLQGYRMNLCAFAYPCARCLSVLRRKMRHGRASWGHRCDVYHPRSVRVRRELFSLSL